MSAKGPSAGQPTDLRRELIIRAFVVKHAGQWTANQQDLLERYLDYYGLGMPHHEVDAMLGEELTAMQRATGSLFVCGGSYCCKHVPALDDDFAAKVGEKLGMTVTWTECQGRCGSAPTATVAANGQVAKVAPWTDHLADIQAFAQAE